MHHTEESSSYRAGSGEGIPPSAPPIPDRVGDVKASGVSGVFLRLKYVAWGAVTGLFIIIGSIAFFYASGGRQDSRETTTTSPEASAASPQPTFAVSASYIASNMIRNSSKTSFSVITETSAIPRAQLPEDITMFICDVAHDVQVEGVKYGDGTKGVRVTYVLLEPVEITYERFIERRAGWNRLMGSRAKLAALMEVENAVYVVRIVQVASGDEASNTVTVSVREK